MVTIDQQYLAAFPRRNCIGGLIVWALGMVCLMATGCGPSPTVVTGTVTLDGQPLDQAGLEFHGSGTGGFTGHAFTDANGRYRATVPATPLVVVIRATKVVGFQKEPAIPGGKPEPIIEQVLSSRYSDRLKTELRITPVAGQTTVADFTLTSDSK
jgi:hypothetical protein